MTLEPVPTPARRTVRRRIGDAGWRAFERSTRNWIPDPEVGHAVPPGRMVELPDRGRTFVVDVPGPTPDAPVVVLLHALVCTVYLSWAAAFADLLPHYRVIGFDQRWHGRGIRSPQFRLTDCAEDVPAVLDALGVRRAVLAGYSMGGAVAQLTARAHPERVAGLVMCSTAESFRVGRLQAGAFALAGLSRPLTGFGARRVSRFGTRLPEVPVMPAADNHRSWAALQFRSTSLWGLPGVLAELARFDSTSWARQLDVPSASVVTTRDHGVSPAAQLRLAGDLDAEVYETATDHAAQSLQYEHWSPAFLAAVDDVCGRASGPWQLDSST